MNGYVMETRQVTKTYGSLLALDHVNIHVRKGCIYGLVGDNGAGKSTLLKLLAGQSFPTKGEIEILGKHGQKDLENVRKQMGCMIEQPGFFPNMTVEQTLRYYCIQKGIPDKGRILEMMKMTGIYEKRKIGRLSAFCGAVNAASGVSAAITWLDTRDNEKIKAAISNTLAIASGIICDGAKPSCAAKISIAVESAYLGFLMASCGDSFHPDEGIVKDDIEKTIDGVAEIARDGMKETDAEILKVMLDKSSR